MTITNEKYLDFLSKFDYCLNKGYSIVRPKDLFFEFNKQKI